MNGIERNFPNSEKAQNMINPVSIEILRHLAQPGFPPRISITSHDLPIIRWKSPVLAFYREIVGWRPCLTIHVKELRIDPRIDTGTTDSYGNIAFQNHSCPMGILLDFG